MRSIMRTGVSSRITATPNVASAPDGTLTADRLTVVDSNFSCDQINIPVMPSTAYTHAVWLRGEGSSIGRTVWIGMYEDGQSKGVMATLTAAWQRVTVIGTTGSAQWTFLPL